MIGRLSRAPDADQALAVLALQATAQPDTLSGWLFTCRSAAQEHAFRAEYAITSDVPDNQSG